MKEQKATLISVSTKTDEEMAWQARKNVVADFEGFVDDVHRGPSRVCYEGDTEPAGTVRRNNRQWSGMSQEEAREIQEALNLAQPLMPADLGVNVFVEGIEDFSKLPFDRSILLATNLRLHQHQVFPSVLRIVVHTPKVILHSVFGLRHISYQTLEKIFLNLIHQ